MSAYHDLTITKKADGTHWLTRLVRWAFECRHDWDITACNGFGTPIEEQCEKCGMYQHRILKAEKLHEYPEWKLGRHPQSPANRNSCATAAQRAEAFLITFNLWKP